MNLTSKGTLKIPLHPAGKLEICEMLCCSTVGHQLCSTSLFAGWPAAHCDRPLHTLTAHQQTWAESTDLQHHLCVLGNNGDDTWASLHLAQGLTAGCSSTAQASLEGWRQHLSAHMAHAARCSIKNLLCCRQDCTEPTMPPVQQQPSTTPDTMRACWVLLTAVPVHKAEVYPLHKRMTKVNRPE